MDPSISQCNDDNMTILDATVQANVSTDSGETQQETKLGAENISNAMESDINKERGHKEEKETNLENAKNEEVDREKEEEMCGKSGTKEEGQIIGELSELARDVTDDDIMENITNGENKGDGDNRREQDDKVEYGGGDGQHEPREDRRANERVQGEVFEDNETLDRIRIFENELQETRDKILETIHERVSTDDRPSSAESCMNYQVNKIRKFRISLPARGDRFSVKFLDNVHLPFKLHLQCVDKDVETKLNDLLEAKLLKRNGLVLLPMSRVKVKGFVLIKYGTPTRKRLIRAQVNWIESKDKIQVVDIDNDIIALVTSQDIYVLDDEAIASIYPRVFICNLSEFDGKDIFWNAMVRDLYTSTLRYGDLFIEIRSFNVHTQAYEVNLKLFLDEKKFINLNDWLANSFIPYLMYLKSLPPNHHALLPTSSFHMSKLPLDVFFPYEKLLKAGH